MEVYKELARSIAWYKSAKDEYWKDQAAGRVWYVAKNYLPAGSGYDAGTEVDLDRSTHDKLVFTTSYHLMEDGSYAGWIDITVTVTPSLAWDILVKVRGSFGRHRDLKDLVETDFYNALMWEVDESKLVKDLGLNSYVDRVV
jgi:hypothetical protein